MIVPEKEGKEKRREEKGGLSKGGKKGERRGAEISSS